VAELAVVKEADRAVKAATKARKTSASGKKGSDVHPVRAVKAAARKTSGKTTRRR
jgi:ribonuclease R